MGCRAACLACLAFLGSLGWLGPAFAGESRSADPSESDLRRAVELRSAAIVDLEEGRFERAAERLEELAEILPQNVLPAVDLAIAYFGLGRSDDALRQADRALALDPDNAQALFAVAWSLRFEPAAEERWHEVASRFAAAHPDDPRPHYLLALHLDALHAALHSGAEREGPGVDASIRDALLRAHDRDPRNLRLALELLEAALAAGDAVVAADALDAAEARVGGFAENSQAAQRAAELRERLAEQAFGFDFGMAEPAAEDLASARPRAAVLHNLLRTHDLYRLGTQRLSGGVAGETFAMEDFLPPLPPSVQGGADVELDFVPLGVFPSVLPGDATHLVPARRRGRDTLLLVGPETRLEVDALEQVRRFEPLDAPPSAVASLDVTGDGATDLVWAPRGGGALRLLSSWFGEEPSSRTLFDFEAPGQVAGLWPLDVDHDGDLDLFTGARFLRNDGSVWTDATGTMGLVKTGTGPVTDVVSADFDDDGDLDVVLLRGGVAVFLENRRAGALVEATESSGLGDASTGARTGARRVELADFDGDGRFDLLLWDQTVPELWRAVEGGFERVDRDFGPGWVSAAHGDVDNDGDVDLVVQRRGDDRNDASLWLLRQRAGEFVAESLWASESATHFPTLRLADLDGDGDLDLAALDGDGRLHRWRNDGGSENHWLRLTLVGREHNNSKNNTQGLFTRVEARVGDRLVAVPGDGGVNHLGLGARRRADVVRVTWPNGLSQLWQQVAADQSLVEEQVLKGSCPFLYVWNGDGFVFVTDLMWRSPLGMVTAKGRAAPHQGARDAVLLPPGVLRPVDGELWLSVTEELWEAAYVDEQRLVAVDHPPGMELVVDESILPPPDPEELPLHLLSGLTPPSSARLFVGNGSRAETEDVSRDVLGEIAVRDETYVGDLPLTRYQGLTHGQTLELRFDSVPAAAMSSRGEADDLRLLLWGWTFPTDTSINVALAADPALDPFGPTLEVWKGGAWQVASPFVGFPAGKRKGMVVELPPDVAREARERGTLRLRLSTSLQVYWDAAALARSSATEIRTTRLAPRAADLHPRGLSKLVRTSPHGPHLFDYDTVTHDAEQTERRFRPMAGAFTRFGDVTELLQQADDRYAVLAAGDEMTVVYDAAELPPLPPGWTRRWVLATDGWVKDADVNTTASQSVAPLPYHAMTGYPDPGGHAYPDTPEHREFLRTYQTRRLPTRWQTPSPVDSERP